MTPELGFYATENIEELTLTADEVFKEN